MKLCLIHTVFFIDFANLNQIGKVQLKPYHYHHCGPINYHHTPPHNQYRHPCHIPYYDSQGLADICMPKETKFASHYWEFTPTNTV